jgi:peptidyl-tRNA hydrolase, PTH1 family
VKLIAGLGNPGPRYADSRHNVGFFVVDELARRWRLGEASYDRHCDGLLRQTERAGERVLLLQPQTYMNLSGRSVAGVWRFYKLALADLLLVIDDLDLPVGHVRIRARGSSGGHNGMTDVIRCVGSDEFARVRIGIGKVDRRATVEYVLGRFESGERDAIAAAVELAADAAECWRAGGIETAMNEYNRPRSGPAQNGESPANRPAEGDRS